MQTKVIFCRKCEQPFDIPVRKGRNPAFCPDCRQALIEEKENRRNNSDAPMTKQCSSCHEDFLAQRVGRGYASVCDSCKASPTSKLAPTDFRQLTGKERVDRLENMLYASGTHIKQHRKDD